MWNNFFLFHQRHGERAHTEFKKMELMDFVKCDGSSWVAWFLTFAEVEMTMETMRSGACCVRIVSHFPFFPISQIDFNIAIFLRNLWRTCLCLVQVNHWTSINSLLPLRCGETFIPQKRQYDFAFEFPVIWPTERCNVPWNLCNGTTSGQQNYHVHNYYGSPIEQFKTHHQMKFKCRKREIRFHRKRWKKNEIQSSYAKRTESLEWV